jgi:hypothetical protein
LRGPGATLALVAALCLAAPAPFARAEAQGVDGNGQRVRALDDPIVADLEDISLESGSLFLSYAAPYSDKELRATLDRIDPDALSAEGRAKYDRVLEALRPDPAYRSGALGAKAGLKIALDANWRSDESIPWIQGYQERPSFLSVPLEAWAGDSVYGFAALDLRRDYFSVNDPVSELSVPNYTSVPIDLIGADVNFPFRAFGAAGGDFWRFSVGRDRLSLGSMGENNLVVNSRTEWYDYARLSFFFRDFQYSAYMVQLDPMRNLYMHRLDFLFFDRFSVGLTEGILVGDAAPELRYFNPLMIFHGYLAWNDEPYPVPSYTGDGTVPASNPSGIGSMLGIELNYNPARYVTLTAQYQFNAGRDPLKMLLWPGATSTIPNSDAYLFGAKLRLPMSGGFLKGELCGVYAEPYDMVLGTNDISYIYRRPGDSSYASGDIEEWIGFSEGPDCVFVSGSLDFETLGRASAGLVGSYRWKGQNDLDTDYFWSSDNAAKVAPTGIVEGRLRLGVRGSYVFSRNWSAEAAAYYINRVNADNAPGATDQSVELMAGLRFEL